MSRPGGQDRSDGLSRRTLIIGTVGLAAAACGSEQETGPALTGTPPAGPETTSTTVSGPAAGSTVDFPSDPFTLGVASGEPLPNAVVLWTRLAPDPLSADGGMPADTAVEVRWELAADDGFADVVAEGSATAESGHAHSVHVDAGGLTPATDYVYRFTVGDFVSPVGRTRTLRAGGRDPFRFVLATCQELQWGEYAVVALRR